MSSTAVIVLLVVGAAILPLLVAVGSLEVWFARWRRRITDEALAPFGEPPMKIRCYVCRQDLWVIADDPLPSIKKHLETEKHKRKVKEKA